MRDSGTTNSTHIIPLQSDRASPEVSGWKGSGLSQLVRLGFDVPPGFILTTFAYDQFVRQNSLVETLLRIMQGVDFDREGSIDEISKEICRLFEGGTIPAGLSREILSAYRELALGQSQQLLPVAVRSSATAEDIPGLVLKAQHDTFLNVAGEAQLLEAIRKCWASLWSTRALSYRVRNRISSDRIAVAVIVQAMFNADSTGVVFTANPATGHRNEIVVKAIRGTGGAAVATVVDPDEYIVDLAWKAIIRTKLGSKSNTVVSPPDGGTKILELDHSQDQVLRDEEINAIAELAGRIADRLGEPQDVEWAKSAGKFFFLQARPITGLYPLPKVTSRKGDLQVYAILNGIQGAPYPLTPLGIDVARELSGYCSALFRTRAPLTELLPDAGGRLFMNLTVPLHSPRLRRLIQLTDVEADAQEILRELALDGRFAPRPSPTLWQDPRMAISLLQMQGRYLRALVSPTREYARATRHGNACIERIWKRASNATNLSETLSVMRDGLTAVQRLNARIVPAAMPSHRLIPVIDDWLVKWLGEPHGAALELLRGLPNDVMTEMDLELWHIVELIKSDPPSLEALSTARIEALVKSFTRGKLPNVMQEAVGRFLERYGMTGTREMDIGAARWREDPTLVFETVKSYLRHATSAKTPAQLFQAKKAEAGTRATSYFIRLRSRRKGWLRARLFSGALKRIRTLTGLRELPFYYMVSAINVYRKALMKHARELVARGILDNDEDIFYLPLDTLQTLAHLWLQPGVVPSEDAVSKLQVRETIKENRVNHAREMLRKRIPRVLLSTGEVFYDPAPAPKDQGDTITGQAVSPGVVEGTVHVVLDPQSAHLEPGEILVCSSTNPAWTPLFFAAGGLVMELDGMITHGSMVARECGIPAVAAIAAATTTLRSGQRVSVDGNRGTVTVLET